MVGTLSRGPLVGTLGGGWGPLVGTYNNRGKSISKGESNLGLCPERTHVIIRLK